MDLYMNKSFNLELCLFAQNEMAAKLSKTPPGGVNEFAGWWHPEMQSVDDLLDNLKSLADNPRSGNFLDIAILAMILHWRDVYDEIEFSGGGRLNIHLSRYDHRDLPPNKEEGSMPRNPYAWMQEYIDKYSDLISKSARGLFPALIDSDDETEYVQYLEGVRKQLIELGEPHPQKVLDVIKNEALLYGIARRQAERRDRTVPSGTE